MKEIITWLIHIEQMAHDFYKAATALLPNEKELTIFLNRLSEDEAWHTKVMSSIDKYLQDNDEHTRFLTLDSDTQERIENNFAKCREMMASGNLTKESLAQCIAEIEFSEWNAIFLFVVNALKDRKKEFIYVAAKIQQHKNDIEKFLSTLPDNQQYLEIIRQLPPVWKPRILVVDDSAPIAELIRDMLSSEGTVELAKNGTEGVKKTRDNYFDVIISDIDMLAMDGIEFYQEVARQYPNIGRRFIFHTGVSSAEYTAFFTENNLRYIIKPARVDKIKQTVADIIKNFKTSLKF